MKIISLVLLFLPVIGYGFEKGSGSEYTLKMQDSIAQLSIYITDKKKDFVNVEFHFGTSGLWISNMWQQFKLDIRQGSSIGISQGFIKTGKDKPVEKMIREQFELNTGVQVHQFLFSEKTEIQKDFIGVETVELPAGTIQAEHYRKVSDGQTVDFWISSKVKPIGLVKLVSKSKIKSTNNYSIELSSLLKNIKPAIDPLKAAEMSQKSKEMFKKVKSKK